MKNSELPPFCFHENPLMTFCFSSRIWSCLGTGSLECARGTYGALLPRLRSKLQVAYWWYPRHSNSVRLVRKIFSGCFTSKRESDGFWQPWMGRKGSSNQRNHTRGSHEIHTFSWVRVMNGRFTEGGALTHWHWHQIYNPLKYQWKKSKDTQNSCFWCECASE